MLVILAIAAIAILACVVLVSLGRGGELSEFPPDVPPLDLPEAGQLTAVDVMALQLPVNLVGYHTASVDETLRRAAGAISARDTRIAVLEQRVSELLASRLYARQEVYASPGAGPRTEHEPEAPAQRELPESGDPVTASGAAVSWDADATITPPEDPEWRVDAVPGRADDSTDTQTPEPVHPAAEPEPEADEPAAAEARASAEPADQAPEGEPPEARAGDEPVPGAEDGEDGEAETREDKRNGALTTGVPDGDAERAEGEEEPVRARKGTSGGE
ncbi:hypothetical protein [Nonomuraea aridisoli]|uniref:DivIVA domain-containing protein n=1 Tax=Nonomuraea aridisoli TaxID=2070368 RepID=A0A2W2FJ93_9ACTN|nr:hypothetical protein [Nonomuraea aridisoli]PZG15314.1 hypothetical protein C1J01_24425 [Nonomuraea aridisoli]